MEKLTKTMRDLSKNSIPKWSAVMPKAININLNFEQK